MKTLIYKDLRIVISENVLEIFSQHKQILPFSKERGGIVLGQISSDTIYINRASTPNKFDISSRYRFEREKEAAQIVVDYEFINSNRKIIYLGEWHTHPEKTPKPSSQDKKMIVDQNKYNTLNEPFLLLIIQGIEDLYVGYYDGENLVQCLEASSP